MENNNSNYDYDERLEEGVDEEDFQDSFPALFREIKSGEKNLVEDESRTAAGSKKVRKFRGYIPSVVDFICRCKTKEEAQEIIEYLLKKGEITEEHAKELQQQLEDKGLEFFGEHRSPGYYERA